MTPSSQTICLCMIVKNEISILARCLDSMVDHIACWIIGDTGSSDGTTDFIQSYFKQKKIPGELHSFAFENFAQARNQALDLARASSLPFNYLLLADADMELSVQDPAALRRLHAPAYTVIQKTDISYWNVRLLRRDIGARYRGVTHEYLDLAGETSESLHAVGFIDHASGSNRDNKFSRDAHLLRDALAVETDQGLIARYTFYLANTLRDVGSFEAALPLYARRSEMGYWDQEVYVSLLNIARLLERLGRPGEDVVAAYTAAARACPTRAEAFHGAARFCRNSGQHARGLQFARSGLQLDKPSAALFLEDWIYDIGLLDEFAVCAYWTEEFQESAEACRTLLGKSTLPFSETERIVKNLGFATAKLRGVSQQDMLAIKAPALPWQPSRPQGGTELMVEALRQRLGTALDAVDLRINLYDPATRDGRPLVVWFHHDVDQAAVQWCRDAALTAAVTRYVFVSHWQQERYRSAFGLPAERCLVIRHALDASAAPRAWETAPVLRCAYTSTPFCGLDILFDVWDRLPAGRAELHVWSSMKLYGMDDDAYAPLLDRARTTPGVVYHGLAPNAELRAALRTMHLLTYPSTFAETACLSVIEALSAGCRVIVPAHGALPETAGGYARVYPWSPDKAVHADLFAEALAQELADPWQGRPGDALAQQAHCATVYSWERCLGDWRRLIGAVGRASSPANGSDTPATATKHSPPFRPAVRRIETRRGPFFITDGDFIGRTLEVEGDWEPHVHDLAALVLTTRSNAIDLGANLGFHTVSFARLASEGEVFAFEPVDLCFSQLQMNLVLNGIDNVRAYKMAVTDRSGEAVEMEAPDATSLGNGLVNIGSTRIGQGGDFTFTLRLDDLRLPRIDLVKIDIQGSEPAALRGMEALIARDRPAILVEVEEYHLRRSGSSSKELIEFLLQRGYNLLRIKTEWPADHLAIPREKTELERRCRAYDRVPTEWISGETVELGFDDAFLYSTVTAR